MNGGKWKAPEHDRVQTKLPHNRAENRINAEVLQRYRLLVMRKKRRMKKMTVSGFRQHACEKIPADLHAIIFSFHAR
jgi:hypothetical protein